MSALRGPHPDGAAARQAPASRPLAPRRRLSAAKPRKVADAAPRYRMRDLCALSGLERQTIHFYIQEGLLPEGRKTGRNMAWYGEDHLERLRLIKTLQEERFLPLRAIRAVLGGKSAGFSDGQRRQIAEVKTHLLGHARGRALVLGSEQTAGVAELADTHGVSEGDVLELIELGLLRDLGGAPGARRVRRDDAFWIAVWGDLERAGLTRARGFSPRDLLLLDEALTQLFERERELFFERLDGRPPEELARVLEAVLPVLSDALARIHASKARDAFALAAATPAAGSPSSSPSVPRSKKEPS